MLHVHDSAVYHQTLATLSSAGAAEAELLLTLLGRFSSRGGFRNRSLSRDTFIPHIIQAGAGHFECEGRVWPASRGDAFVFFPDRPVYYHDVPGKPWRYTWVVLEGPAARWALAQAGFTPDSPFRKGGLDVLLEPLFREVEEAFGTERHSALFPTLAAWRLVEALCPRADTLPKTQSPEVMAESARFFLDRAFSQDVGIDQLARHLRVTRSTLFRHFRSSFGVSPKRYLTTLRVDQAKRLLLQSAASVKEIAAACGFRDVHGFCRAFRGETGLSPRAWQRKEARP